MRFVEMAHIGFRYTDRDDLRQFVLDTSGIFEEASIQFFSCYLHVGRFTHCIGYSRGEGIAAIFDLVSPLLFNGLFLR